jgi:L-lactate dehydrogenase complex protein LldE
MRIGLFVTCLVDGMFPDVGDATVTLLERLGHHVDVPLTQTCCGQMHINSGYARDAVALLRRQVAVFEGYDAVVAPSASCVGSVRHQYATVAAAAGDRGLVRDVTRLADGCYELSEFLVGVLGVTDVGAYYPHRVTYHPTCHSLRLLRVGEAPLRLLRAVRGIDLVELPAAESCCGFGGTFALKNSEVSAAMLTDKIADVLSTRAELVAAADSSCLMQIGGGLSRLRAGVRPVHLAQVLAATAPAPSSTLGQPPPTEADGR